MSFSIVVLWLIVVYFAVGEPFLGIRMYRRLMSGQMTRMSFYRKIVLMEWCLAAIVCIAFAVGGIPLKLLYTFPIGMGSSHGMSEAWLAGIVVGSLAGGIGFAFQSRRQRQSFAYRRWMRPQVDGFAALLPQSRRERLSFIFLCITAGICEEILFRGMPMYLLHNQISGITMAEIVVVTSVVFGAAHAYQGWRGILAAAVFGAVLMFGYAQIGTLWVLIIIHTIIDLRALLLPANSTAEIPYGT